MADFHDDYESPISQDERWMDDDFIEAFEDFRSLSILTESLISRILHTRHKLEGQFQEDEITQDAYEYQLRYSDWILDVLQITKDEIDVLILNFNRPSKTFFEANIDQSVLIGRLWSLLPSAKPFLCPPSIPGTGHDMRGADGEYWACATRVVRIKSEEDGGTAAERFPRDGRGGGAVKRERENEAVAMGCFDRGPRSRSVLPSTRGPPKREFRWAAPLSLS